MEKASLIRRGLFVHCRNRTRYKGDQNGRQNVLRGFNILGLDAFLVFNFGDVGGNGGMVCTERSS